MTREEMIAIVSERMAGSQEAARHTHIECFCPDRKHRRDDYDEGCFCPDCAAKAAVDLGYPATDTQPEAEGPDDSPYRVGNEREGMRAFIWGKEPGHVDVYQLPNALLRDVIPEGQNRPGARSYYDAIEKITQAFGDAWMLPAIEIRRIAARLDLLAAKRVLDKAIEDAAAEGVDAGELLSWTKQRRGS